MENQLKAGDRIRILVDWLEMARVYAGDVLTVVHAGDTLIATNAPRLVLSPGTHWQFPRSAEGTGWERI